MRVLVCGGRHFSDAGTVNATLSRLHSSDRIEVLIHGAQTGADTLAAEWAQRNSIQVQPFPADWSRGPSAGPIRNARMLAEGKPEWVIAFKGGRGTADMVRKAKRANVPVLRIDDEGPA